MPDVFVNDAAWVNIAPGVQRRVLGHDEALMMVEVKFESGAIGSVHDHPHRQVTYVAHGDFEVVVDGKRQVLKPGDSFFVPSGAKHGVVALTGGTLVDVFTPAREDFI